MINLIYTRIPGINKINNYVDISHLKKGAGELICSTELNITRNEITKPMISSIHNIGNKRIVSSAVKSEYIEFDNEEEMESLTMEEKFNKSNRFFIKPEPDLQKK